MFVEAGYKEDEVADKIRTAYEQLYHTGSVERQRIYYELRDENTSYVTDVKNHDVRTEGMGYAMMVMVQMNNQTGFDMLWRYVKLHMLHKDPSDPLYGWSAWHTHPNGTRISNGPAPDGETWFITTLYFAHVRWGQLRYKKDADMILHAVNHEKDVGNNMFAHEVNKCARMGGRC